MKRVTMAILCVALLLSLAVTPAYANSAQSRWEGVDATGAIMPDQDSPIVVEKERLSFDIQQFPQSYYISEAEYLAYTPKVTAEYTFYNPSQYTVTATLLFPFGNPPIYADGTYDDTEKFDITVNGESVAKKIRHTLSDGYRQFALEQDLALIVDGFASDDFYSPDMLVTKYTFQVTGVDMEAYRAASLAFDVPRGQGESRIYLPTQSGQSIQRDGDLRVQTWVQTNGWKFDLYVFGAPLTTMPQWAAYQDGGVDDGEEIGGNVFLVDTQTATFREFALSGRDAQSPVLESDWYNAVLAQLKNSQENTPDHPVASCRDRGLEQNLMRWYEYTVTLAPGERMVNAVTAPIYPAIDLGYEPDIFKYTYLLSPAKTWKSFGELEIVVNTPYYVTDSSLAGFRKTDTGYALELEGLPEGELEFTLSTGEAPKKELSPYGKTFAIILLVLAGFGLLLGGGIGLAVWLWRRRKQKRHRFSR